MYKFSYSFLGRDGQHVPPETEENPEHPRAPGPALEHLLGAAPEPRHREQSPEGRERGHVAEEPSQEHGQDQVADVDPAHPPLIQGPEPEEREELHDGPGECRQHSPGPVRVGQEVQMEIRRTESQRADGQASAKPQPPTFALEERTDPTDRAVDPCQYQEHAPPRGGKPRLSSAGSASTTARVAVGVSVLTTEIPKEPPGPPGVVPIRVLGVAAGHEAEQREEREEHRLELTHDSPLLLRILRNRLNVFPQNSVEFTPTIHLKQM